MTATEPVDTALDIPQITFRGGLPGFDGLEAFALAQFTDDEDSGFAVLQSLDDAELSFVVMTPSLFFPDYEPTISDDTASEIGLTDAAYVPLLTIVTVGDPVSTSTANLLGPIVVNLRQLRGVQAVLDPDRYSSVTPLAVSPAPAEDGDEVAGDDAEAS